VGVEHDEDGMVPLGVGQQILAVGSSGNSVWGEVLLALMTCQ